MCFTTHNALNGVPLPILQKLLGRANIRTTSCYWKGSVDVRNFAEWLEPDSSPKEPDKVPQVKMRDNSQLPKIPQIPTELEKPSLDNAKEPELLKTIAKPKSQLLGKIWNWIKITSLLLGLICASVLIYQWWSRKQELNRLQSQLEQKEREIKQQSQQHYQD